MDVDECQVLAGSAAILLSRDSMAQCVRKLQNSARSDTMGTGFMWKDEKGWKMPDDPFADAALIKVLDHPVPACKMLKGGCRHPD